MAKSKKRKNSALKYIKYGAVLFAIIGVAMAFLAYVNIGDSLAYSGFQVIFGHSGKASVLGFVTEKQILNFSILSLLAVLLPLVGSFSIVSKNKIVKLVGSLMMIAGAVLCFIVPNLVVYASDAIATTFKALGISLGVGAILSGIFFSIGALCNLYAVVEK